MTTIRTATPADLAAITAIYNEAVLNTTATFDTEPKSVAQRQRWFDAHDARHPIVVAEREQAVVGWASLSRWSDRPAYAGTAEVSLYVKAGQRGQGIGRQLMRAILERGQVAGLHTILARIADGNEASVRLHQTAGFSLVGVMQEVGYKFDRWLDVQLMQKIYDGD